MLGASVACLLACRSGKRTLSWPAQRTCWRAIGKYWEFPGTTCVTQTVSDPVSGRRYPEEPCSFRIDYRKSDDDRRIKQLWELSRHHHLTVLAAAWQVSGNRAYPEMVARHLRSWWGSNPPLCGANWTSGIEIGIRLISWVWVRRLLDNWDGI